MRPFTVALSGVGHFERKGIPHAIWARVQPSAELTALQRSVEHACRAAGLPPETRAFLPHVTIARLNRSTAPIGEWLARHGTLSASWQAESFGLYQSHLTRGGSLYERIASFPDDEEEEE
jgi:2'-5' RNA ligase